MSCSCSDGSRLTSTLVPAINALLLGQLPKKAVKPLAWEGDGDEPTGEQALFQTFMPQWAQAELMQNNQHQSIGTKQPQMEFQVAKDEISEEQASRPVPTHAITSTTSLLILATTWQSNKKFHIFLWKLPSEKFKLGVEVTNSRNSIKISFKCLLPSNNSLMKIATDVLGLLANKITEIRNFTNSYKAMPCDRKIQITPTHQVLSTNHMNVANVDDISCLTFPFFNVDKKDGKKKI